MHSLCEESLEQIRLFPCVIWVVDIISRSMLLALLFWPTLESHPSPPDTALPHKYTGDVKLGLSGTK